MVYIYRQQASTGARELAAALGGKRLRGNQERGLYTVRRNLRYPVRLGGTDAVVCWGTPLPTVATAARRILNNTPVRSKYQDALTLTQAGVPTIEVRVGARPTAVVTAPQVPIVDPAIAIYTAMREQAEEFTQTEFGRNTVMIRGIDDLMVGFQRLREAIGRPLQTPAPLIVQQVWLSRSNSHVGGDDLLHPPAQADFWARRENIIEEYRIHSFLGKSIRAGKKVPRVGFTAPHEWIRSYEGGWMIQYDGFESKKAMRDLAARAVEALGLQFGAVDIALVRNTDGTTKLIVLEVNRAPGLEGNTTTTYATAIRRWMDGAEGGGL